MFENYQQRGRLFAELAYCEMRLGRFTTAEERCQIALKLLDPRRNPKDVAQVYNVLGTVRWKTSRYEEAEQYFSTCLTLREKIGDKLAVARIYNNLAVY
jgi:tetratricopeptide (TPR) repeat protein